MSASTKSLQTGFGVSGADTENRPGVVVRSRHGLRDKIDRWFPDRQILIRGPDKMAAVHVSQRGQLAAAGALGALLLGLTVTSAGFYISWRAETTAALTAARLQAALAAEQADAARERADDLAASRAGNREVAQADLARDIAIAQAAQARDEAVAQAVRAQALEVARAEQARDAAIARADQAIAASDAALDGLIQQTKSTLGQVESVFRSTGLDPDRLAAEPGPAAPGPAAPVPAAPGPQRTTSAGDTDIPAAGFVLPAGLPDVDAERAKTLVAELARLHELSAVLAQVPLSSPTAQAVISSGFGLRADPFTGAPEFHVGIDLPGPIGAPVYATAPGIVTFAGDSTGYGNLVTIDHGYGLSTRYSHLNKILVKLGSVVALHQEIGLLGNTGWSTGPHLLYETRVDGQPQNPVNFIKVNPYDVQN
jgi:murein DD-endopeptidase MepM/ murein hydrolase activator NlpD